MQKINLAPNLSYAILRPFGHIVLAILLIAAMLALDSFIFIPYLPYVAIGTMALLLILYIYKFLYIRSIKYTVTLDQIYFSRGVFSVKTDFLHLYRVKDISVERSFLLRTINAMTVTLDTSDKSHPIFYMKAVPSSDIANTINNLVETSRRGKVMEID